jgi:cell division protein FtsI/penicillin-binding protein 2
MGPAPWWVTLLVGVLTVSSSFLAARIGSNRAIEATDQREEASAREEWWRRFHWATEQAMSEDARTSLVGVSLLEALYESHLAGVDELRAMAGVLDIVVNPPIEGAQPPQLDPPEADTP